jgi:hypothetical protein
LKISAQLTVVIAAIFAAVCFGVAILGFKGIGEMTDATQIADARGYAMFWTFLGVIAVAMGALSAWIIRTQKNDTDS